MFEGFVLRGFEDFGDVSQVRIGHEKSEGFGTEAALAEVFVAVFAAAKGCFGVVAMDDPEPVVADEAVKLGPSLAIGEGGGEVVAGGKSVSGVEADAKAFGPADAIEESCEVFEAMTEGTALAGGTFEGEADAGAGELGKGAVEEVSDGIEAFFFGGGGVGAGVEDEEGKAELFGALEFGDKGVEGFVGVGGVSGTGVDEVAGVPAEPEAEAFGFAAEGFRFAGCEGWGHPLFVIFDKDLGGVRTDGEGAFKGALDTAGDGGVGTEAGRVGFIQRFWLPTWCR